MNKFRVTFFVSLGILLTSCDKSYSYIERINETSILGGTKVAEKEGKIIKVAQQPI
jgi:hypothetical protein